MSFGSNFYCRSLRMWPKQNKKELMFCGLDQIVAFLDRLLSFLNQFLYPGGAASFFKRLIWPETCNRQNRFLCLADISIDVSEKLNVAMVYNCYGSQIFWIILSKLLPTSGVEFKYQNIIINQTQNICLNSRKSRKFFKYLFMGKTLFKILIKLYNFFWKMNISKSFRTESWSKAYESKKP